MRIKLIRQKMLQIVRDITGKDTNRLNGLLLLLCFSACQGPTQQISGLYQTKLPLAQKEERMDQTDSLEPTISARHLELHLMDDHQADLFVALNNETAPLVLRGSWIKSSSKGVTVYLVERNGVFWKDTLKLAWQTGQLSLRDEQFSTAAIVLYKQAED